MKLVITLLAVLIIFTLSLVNWRSSVKAVLFILVLEGVLRKWVLPQASEMIYFLKDLVLLAAYIRYCFSEPSPQKYLLKNHPINVLIFIGSAWCIFQAINPSLGSIIIGFWGIKNYLFYVPLVWIMPTLFKSEEELANFCRNYLLLIIPVGLLGLVQFASPISSPINSYAPGLESEIATFGNGTLVRITSTFSYINNYTAYLVVCFSLLIPLFLKQQTLLWRLIYLLEIGFIAVNSVMTGSRAPVIAAGLFLFGFMGATAITRPAITLRLLQWLFPSAILISIAASFWFQKAFSSFLNRATGNQDVSDRIWLSIMQPISLMRYKNLDGYGTGATHPANGILRQLLNLSPGEVIPEISEPEPGKIMLELGLIGFIFWYGLRIGLLIALWLLFWRLKRQFLRHLALSAFLVQIIWLNGQMVFLHTFAVYYWFLSGFIFLLPRLEQIENWRQQQQRLQSSG